MTTIHKQVPQEAIDRLWQAMSGHLFDAVHNAVTNMIYEGYPLSSILSQLHDELISKKNLSDLDKALICEKLAEVTLSFVISNVHKILPASFYRMNLGRSITRGWCQ